METGEGVRRSMDFMVGTVDAKRLRRDLLQMYRKEKNMRSPTVQNEYYAIQEANQQQLIALAKKEGFEMRKYMR